MVRLVYGLALISLVLPFLLQHPVYEPHRDEFLFLAEGRHLAWGYLEAPPLLSVLSFLTNALGAGFFWIKFWPALFGAMTYVLVGRMILLLGGGRQALLLGFLPFVFGFFLRVHFLLEPGFLGMYFQTLMAYGLVRFLRTGKPGGLYLVGIGFGLGALSQNTTLLFSLGLLVGLLLTPERKVLRNPHFHFALMLGGLLFLPNVIWQALHEWPMFGSLRGWRPELSHALGFARDQLAFELPGIFILAAGLYGLFRMPGYRRWRCLGWAVIVALGLSMLFWVTPVDALGVYPVLFVFGAMAAASGRMSSIGGKTRRAWRYGVIGFAVVTGCVVDSVALPMLPPRALAATYSRMPMVRQLGFLRWEDGRDHALPQNFADMLGWEEMALKAAKAYDLLDSLDKTGVLLNSRGNYGEGGALDYYGPKYLLPPVMGRGVDYLLWTPPAYYDRDVFIVTTKDRQELKGCASTMIVDSVTHPYSTEYRSYIILMRATNAAVRQEWKREDSAAQRRQLAVR